MTKPDDYAGEPVAVIGIGCRLPGGVTDGESLWKLLEGQVDAIGPIPQDRWDVERYYAASSQQPGRMNAREGGFLDEVDTFDAAFFGISGRIAEQMDPQQRLLLEVCWEAFEDGGVSPHGLAGSRTGVFMGGCSQDYGALQGEPSQIEGLGPHSATGTFMSIISNRLSYTFDLRGPSMTIDTACSSSLAAVHLACQSLQNGESDLALAGGVNLMLTPQFAIALSQASMLSPDGRSKAFDAAANGYVRGEGAGVVLLKPLSKALLDRDRIYAVIRGSAVNQDGRTQGITVPSGASQEANFRAALSRARVAAQDIGYVEAHGTGTPVGDPIEANALGRVLSDKRESDRVAFVGSIKTNIGHLEAGAGIAGLIKAVLSVYKRQIPGNLHFQAPNPEIDFDRWGMEVPTSTRAWPEYFDRAIASVNSFGFGGTNANVVLEEPPSAQLTVDEQAEPRPAVLALSAGSAQALTQLAENYASWLEAEPVDLEQLGANLALRRSHHAHRLAVIASDAADAATKLRGFATGELTPGAISGGTKPGGTGKLAFLFNGQGPQWFAMGRTLLNTSEVFRAKIMECDQVARKYIDWSIYDELLAPDESSSKVNDTYCLQPTMFSVQVALAELWKSWGIVPDGVAGHSMGEIAAAHVSGALDLDAALKVICRRAAIQEKADPTGAMMFVALNKDDAQKLCAEHPDQLWVSAENGPVASTLSGRRDLIEELEVKLRGQGVFARVLRVNCACHSPDMEPLREELLRDLDGVTGGDTAVPMYSTVTGARIEGHELATSYWWNNFRQPVLFAPAIRAMLADGFDGFVELSPHPVLANSLKEILAAEGTDAQVVSSLARKKDDWECFLEAFGTLAVRRDVAWERRYPTSAPVLDLPKNPWIRETYWNESETSRQYRAGGQAHPMLKRVDAVRPTWEIRWDDHRLTWVKEHDVLGSVIVPGASYVEAALAAARELTGENCALEYLEFERACVLDADEQQVTRLELDPVQGTFEFHHRPVRKDGWRRASRGRFYRTPQDSVVRVFDVDAIRERCATVHKPLDVYGVFREKGYSYGPAFCGISKLHMGDGEALARIQAPRVLKKSLDGYLLHPAVLDACFQSAILHPSQDRPGELLPFSYLPTGIDNVRIHDELSLPLWCYTLVRKLDASGLRIEIYVLDEQGRVVAEYAGLHGKVVPRPEADAADRIDSHFYRTMWQPDRHTVAAHGPLPTAFTLNHETLLSELEPVSRELSQRVARPAETAGYQADVHGLCAAYVVGALRKFGRELTIGESFKVEDFAALLPSFSRAFTRFLRFLVEDGVLSEQDGVFQVVSTLDTDPEGQWSEALSRHPSRVWELLLVRRTGEHLHEVLTGDADPLTLLFPAGAAEGVGPIYETSPVSRFYNLLAKEAIERLVRTADPRRTLRVLEVGGGTGGLTATVLPVLPADRCEYTFTDVSPAFTQSASELFQDYDFVEYRTLDIENDPLDQGIEEGSYDLVLAADVVHATADLKKTLSYLQSTLAPGGVLALIEAEPGNRWLDLTFGLTQGWWSFRDLNLRAEGPLLKPAEWENLLRSIDYDDVVALVDPEREGAGGQSVVLGRAPESVLLPEEEPASAPDQPRWFGDWVIFADSSGLGADIASRIEKRGGRAVLVHPDGQSGAGVTVRSGQAADHDRLFESIEPEGIIYLWKPAADDADGTELERAIEEGCVGVASVVQALVRKAPDEWPRLYVLTRGAHPLHNDTVRIEGAPAWGLGLVAGLEMPQTQWTMIDLDADPTPGEADAVWAQLCRQDFEREIAVRDGLSFTRRVARVNADAVHPPVVARDLPAETGFALKMATPGPLDELNYVAARRIEPAAGQVEVEVVASGLNFLDVMTALGQVPPLESAHELRFGAECAGIVRRVGDGVTDVAVGDAVVAVSSAQGTLGSFITLDANCVAGKPEQLTFEEAASVPIVFLTAWYGLHKLARLEAGERVLIHSAAGGTGLAALQVARMTGAEVLATAGSPEKRALLRSLGVQHVMDSRSPGFAEEVMAATDGAGVDVVLSSSGGDSSARSIACLAPYGRFVEIGKADFMNDSKLGLRPFLRNLAYFSFDLRQTLVDRPKLVRAELEQLLEFFAEGKLRPLPYRVYHPSQIQSAFRQMAAAKHIGKLVVAMDQRDFPVAVPESARVAPEGTWLITGGLGGVGLAMAESLVQAGVRHLALVGRSTTHDEKVLARVDDLRAQGAEVLVESVDVTSRTQVEGLLNKIGDSFPPLRGVLHCAMVLDDALLSDLDEKRFANALRVKVLGAWNLHELTRDLPLDAFVLFSSATSFIGNVGQANYGAANAFLDHLAAVRRADGLPALSVNWGAVSDAGYVASHEDVQRFVAATGMRGFTAKQAFEAMTTLSTGALPQAGVLPMDWPKFFRHHGLEQETSPRYETLFNDRLGGSDEGGDSAATSLRQQLRSHEAAERVEILTDRLKVRVATVLGIPLDALDTGMPLMDYLDSLLAVEISSWLERELGVKVTIMELMKGPSIAQLTDQLLDQMSGVDEAMAVSGVGSGTAGE